MKFFKLFLLCFAQLMILGSDAANANVPLDYSAKVDQLVTNAIEKGYIAGASVYFIDTAGVKLRKHYGLRDVTKGIAPDDDTLYELGSVSKTFTRLLLATQTDVRLSDPISMYLPTGVKAPKPSGQELRIQDLALHTGFAVAVPCVADAQGKPLCFNFSLNASDPYKDMTQQSMFEFVNAYSDWVAQIPDQFPAPGRYYSYSNVGMGLLGNLLAQRRETTYRDLLMTEVLRPLGLNETDMDLTCEQTDSCANMAEVYHRSQDGKSWEQGSRWHLPAINGAGGIRSSLHDMSRYLDAELGLLKNKPLGAAIAKSQMRLPDAEEALQTNDCSQPSAMNDACNKNAQDEMAYFGWPSVANRSMFFHAGETGNSQSMVAFSQDLKVGVVILSNSIPGANMANVSHVPNDIALCALQIAGKTAGFDACSAYWTKYK